MSTSASSSSSSAVFKLNGHRVTANGKGFDMGKPCYRIDEWVSSFDGKLPLLDVGCGYGTNTAHALKAGARVVAVDYAETHLRTLREEAGADVISSGQLQTQLGKLPNDIDLPPECASGLLCAQVMHFLDLDGVKASLRNFYRWLKPGGKLMVLACGHYVMFNLSSGHVRVIHEIMERDGQENTNSAPGYLPEGKFQELVGHLKRSLPDDMPTGTATDGTFQTFSDGHMAALVREAGFEVTHAEMCSGTLSNYPEFLAADPSSLPNDLRPYVDKDQVVVIAVKPTSHQPAPASSS